MTVAACAGVEDPGGGGGGGGDEDSWFGVWSASRMDWNYSCANGNSGSAFTENLTKLRVEQGASADRLIITQIDLNDTQAWECAISGNDATVERTVDTTNEASEFGAHNQGVVVTNATGVFTLEGKASLTTLWNVDYTMNGAPCSENITGRFVR